MKNFQIALLLVAGCLVMESQQWTPIYGALLNIPAWTCALSMGEDGEAAQKVFLLQKLTTRPEKCLQYCTFRALGLMDGTKIASEPIIVAIYLVVHVGLVDKMLNAQRNVHECTNEDLLAGKTDPCEIAATIAECFRKQG